MPSEQQRPANAVSTKAFPPFSSASSEKNNEAQSWNRLLALSLASLGIVYGDIGTSPLYAFAEALRNTSNGTMAIFGILSLIFWALIIVVSIKHLTLIMRADNRGEGGILALLSRLNLWGTQRERKRGVLIAIGLFGAALLYGDGMITPAISVLSALEGIETVAPSVEQFIVPVTVVILVTLFALQSRGTNRVAAFFGPIMIAWFATLGILGGLHIWSMPQVLEAINPRYAIDFLDQAPAGMLTVIGAVFLAVTGAEALYADMGHFGCRPIRFAWFSCVLPCLTLNYFGQGALVLADPHAATNPFYHMVPAWGRYPLIALATVATIIASQAVISGAFSLTRQAIQFGFLPQMRIVQTSSEEAGQIYIPFINVVLALAAIGLVVGFQSSDSLAGAYGLAVSTTMVITTVLAFFVMHERWHWSLAVAGVCAGLFLLVDAFFFAANGLKVLDGGWLPLLIGLAVFTLMTTWYRGRELLIDHISRDIEPLGTFLKRLAKAPPVRVPGTAVFLTAPLPGAPPILGHHLKYNQVLHERVILLTVLTENVPRVSAASRLEVDDLGQGLCQILVHYGYMQTPNVPLALRLAGELGLQVDLETTTYYLGRSTLLPTERVAGMQIWREWLFVVMVRNAGNLSDYYHLPPERVVELGLRIEI